MAQSTRLLSGWGLKYFDYDNDGAMDLLLANGHPDDMIGEYSLQVKWKEPLLLFHQGQDGKLHKIGAEAGSAFAKFFNARGLAVGDYDNDGALDVLVCVNGGAPLLLKNNAAHGNNWLGITLEGVNLQPRRHWRKSFLGGRRNQTLPAEDQRRKLSFLARSANCVGFGKG